MIRILKNSKLLIVIFNLFSITVLNSCRDIDIDSVIKKSKTYLGTPYEYGGSSKKGIDCSAFIKQCFDTIGVKLPRRAVQQSQIGTEIDLKEAKKGDLLFFKVDKEIDHVGLVIDGTGNNLQFIHASGYHDKVLISNFSTYEKRGYFVKAMRVIE